MCGELEGNVSKAEEGTFITPRGGNINIQGVEGGSRLYSGDDSWSVIMAGGQCQLSWKCKLSV